MCLAVHPFIIPIRLQSLMPGKSRYTSLDRTEVDPEVVVETSQRSRSCGRSARTQQSRRQSHLSQSKLSPASTRSHSDRSTISENGKRPSIFPTSAMDNTLGVLRQDLRGQENLRIMPIDTCFHALVGLLTFPIAFAYELTAVASLSPAHQFKLENIVGIHSVSDIRTVSDNDTLIYT